MIDTVLFSSPIMIALVAIVSVLHIASAVPLVAVTSDEMKKTLSAVFAVLGILAHIALFATALVLKAKAEELFLAVMISVTVGMLSVYISEKLGKSKSSKDEVKEENDGI